MPHGESRTTKDKSRILRGFAPMPGPIGEIARLFAKRPRGVAGSRSSFEGAKKKTGGLERGAGRNTRMSRRSVRSGSAAVRFSRAPNSERSAIRCRCHGAHFKLSKRNRCRIAEEFSNGLTHRRRKLPPRVYGGGTARGGIGLARNRSRRDTVHMFLSHGCGQEKQKIGRLVLANKASVSHAKTRRRKCETRRVSADERRWEACKYIRTATA